jgi:uncharacterized protein (TIGR00725 family)
LAHRVISVFGGSRCCEPEKSYLLALELGEALAKAGFAVATGGYAGTMEAVSRGAAGAGGHVIGVISSFFPDKANRWVKETIVVPKWEDRLLRLIALGSGYVVCPGSTGTLVELAAAWEMTQKRVIPPKPLVALGTFWQPVVACIEAADDDSRNLVSLAQTVPEAVAALRAALMDSKEAAEGLSQMR